MQRTDQTFDPQEQSKCFFFFFSSSRWKETLFNPEGKTGPYCTGHFLSQISLAIANFELTHHSGGCRSGRTMPRVPSTSQAVGPASSTGHWGWPQAGQQRGKEGTCRAGLGKECAYSAHPTALFLRQSNLYWVTAEKSKWEKTCPAESWAEDMHLVALSALTLVVFL